MNPTLNITAIFEFKKLVALLFYENEKIQDEKVECIIITIMILRKSIDHSDIRSDKMKYFEKGANPKASFTVIQ